MCGGSVLDGELTNLYSSLLDIERRALRDFVEATAAGLDPGTRGQLLRFAMEVSTLRANLRPHMRDGASAGTVAAES